MPYAHFALLTMRWGRDRPSVAPPARVTRV